MSSARRKKIDFATAVAMIEASDASGSEHNDSDGDPDYVTESESASDEVALEEPVEEPERPNPVESVENAKRKRHNHPAANTWKQNICKKKRLKGESYKNRKGREKRANTMGSPCNSEYCRKPQLRNCESLSEEQRQWIFDKIWSMESWKERRIYVQTLVTKVSIKQKKVSQSRRQTSFSYQLKLRDGTCVPVCKPLFASTIGLPERTVTSWLKNVPDEDGNDHRQLMTPKSGKTAPVQETDVNFVKNWLSGTPSVPSHYCRNTPAYQDKKFLYPGTTIANLYDTYMKAAKESSARVVSMTFFSELFHQENYSVFIPRKDQCDVCVSAKHGNADSDIYSKHIRDKDDARAEKARDKETSDDRKFVWTMDLQAVLLSPKTKASAMYYKTKLQVHNFTLFNLRTKEGYCYVWNECEGDLSSDVSSYLQYQHFSQILDENPSIEEIIIWSDGCGYQNRNLTVANAYLDLAMQRRVKIVQKYLVAGHTQMECDSMHSTIERKMVIDIYTPRVYIVIMKTARIRPSPYHVREVSHGEIKKLDGKYMTSIRPGKKTGDPTVHQLRGLEFQTSGQVRYKLEFSGDSLWEALPQRITIPTEPFEWIHLFDAPIPIKLRKYNGLQSMKHVMPQCSHHFYDSLPHV